jgi:hypothetical protein
MQQGSDMFLKKLKKYRLKRDRKKLSSSQIIVELQRWPEKEKSMPSTSRDGSKMK